MTDRRRSRHTRWLVALCVTGACAFALLATGVELAKPVTDLDRSYVNVPESWRTT